MNKQGSNGNLVPLQNKNTGRLAFTQFSSCLQCLDAFKRKKCKPFLNLKVLHCFFSFLCKYQFFKEHAMEKSVGICQLYLFSS